MNKSIEWVGTFAGQEVKIKTIRPTPAIFKQSQKYVQLAFKEALSSGALLKIEAEKELKSRRVDVGFTDEDTEKLTKEIKDKEVALLRGRDGFKKLTKADGRALAIEIMGLRNKLNNLGVSAQDLMSRTAEKKADDEQWTYCIYACTLDSGSNRPVFKSFDEFKEGSDDPFMIEATRNFYKNLLEVDFMERNTEQKWLIKYGFMNKDGQFLNTDGKTVDELGRLVNKDGRLINEAGNFIDQYGNRVDEAGQLVIAIEADIYSE